MDERIRKLASNLLNHSVRLKKDEKILREMENYQKRQNVWLKDIIH